MGLIDINIVKETQESGFNTMKILSWIIPFMLGLLSAIIIDLFRSKLNKRKLKKFTIEHLKNDIVPQLNLIKNEYIETKDYIERYDPERRQTKVFESFNGASLEAATLTDYYSAFKNDFSKLNEIKSTINFLIQHLPGTLIDNYFTIINAHLKEKEATANMTHVKTCPFCIDSRDYFLKTIDLRIKEVQDLIEQIDNLIIKYD